MKEIVGKVREERVVCDWGISTKNDWYESVAWF